MTVEKKEGRLKNRPDVTVTDLPGIYSLSPYSLEEIIARNYLLDEKPDVILNIVDGTNLERNLYLTTQLLELGIPVVVAINMMDVLAKSGDLIDTDLLEKELGCEVTGISALKETGVAEAVEKALASAQDPDAVPVPRHRFSGSVEHALAHIEEAVLHDLPEHVQRGFAIRLFERDGETAKRLNLSDEWRAHLEQDIRNCEEEMDNDCESIIAHRTLQLDQRPHGKMLPSYQQPSFRFGQDRRDCHQPFSGLADFRRHHVLRLLCFRHITGRFCNGLDE